MKSRNRKFNKKLMIIFVAVSIFIMALINDGCSVIPQTGCFKRDGVSPKIETAIDKFRASVPAIMEKGKIPGCAFALVDKKGDSIGQLPLRRHINRALQEHQPGVFFTASGVALDSTGKVPTWGNFRLAKQ